MAVLRVIQQVLGSQLLVDGNQVLSRQDGSLTALVETEAAQVHHKTELDRPVEEVWLGEAETDVSHARAELRFDGERFTQPQKVVGGIVEPHEAARDTRHAAVHADGVLAAFLNL